MVEASKNNSGQGTRDGKNPLSPSLSFHIHPNGIDVVFSLFSG
jgi:hypothetical protein